MYCYLDIIHRYHGLCIIPRPLVLCFGKIITYIQNKIIFFVYYILKNNVLLHDTLFSFTCVKNYILIIRYFAIIL